MSSSNSLIEDLKKKIKAVEQELAIIASIVKDLSALKLSSSWQSKKKKVLKRIIPRERKGRPLLILI